MNTQEAKTKIENLLQLGTLRGVRVEYDDEDNESTFFMNPNGDIYFEYNDRLIYSHETDGGIYSHIKSITPISLKPKLLEVGTIVRIIGGEQEHIGKLGMIKSNVNENITEYFVCLEGETSNTLFSSFYVVPESLLVEEEEELEKAFNFKVRPLSELGIDEYLVVSKIGDDKFQVKKYQASKLECVSCGSLDWQDREQ